MARDDPHFRLRIPAALKEKIELFAEANNRSINSEIVHRLENSFSPQLEIEISDKSEETRSSLEKLAFTVAMETLKAAGYPVGDISEKDKIAFKNFFENKSDKPNKPD